MKKFKLAELLNLHIAPGDRKLNRGIEEFIACVLSEYAIGYLNFDVTDNAVYHGRIGKSWKDPVIS